MASSAIETALATYEDEGFVILEDVFGPDELRTARAALEPYLALGLEGRNDFEGEKTQRVYSLVGRGRIFERAAEHPRVLELIDRLLDPGYLLTASQAICIHPGESPQPVHYDDVFYPIARPRRAISVSTIWALTDFTAANGGTQVIPGSHRWDDRRVTAANRLLDPRDDDAELARHAKAATMRAGSVMIFAGTLLHRGGPNQSSATRHAMSHQYCEPWARQQENFTLSIPPERARAMSPRLRAMLGYSIHPPFMGQLAARHPEKALARDYQNSLITDDDAIEVARRRRSSPDEA